MIKNKVQTNCMLSMPVQPTSIATLLDRPGHHYQRFIQLDTKADASVPGHS